MEKTIDQVNAEIKAVVEYLYAHPEVEIKSTFSGSVVEIGGVKMVSYACSGLQPLGAGYLPSAQINYKDLEDAQAYRDKVRQVASSLQINMLKSKYGRIWRHDGKKFVEI